MKAKKTKASKPRLQEFVVYLQNLTNRLDDETITIRAYTANEAEKIARGQINSSRFCVSRALTKAEARLNWYGL